MKEQLLLENLRLRNKKMRLEIKMLQNQLNVESSGDETNWFLCNNKLFVNLELVFEIDFEGCCGRL